MSRTAWGLAWFLCCACGEVMIGEDRCLGAQTTCQSPAQGVVETLYIDFNVRSLTDLPLPRPLRVVRSGQSPCFRECTHAIELARASGDAVWTERQAPQGFALALVDAEGASSVEEIAPAQSGTPGAVFVSSDPAGQAVAHLQWTRSENGTFAPGPKEIVVVSADGAQREVPLEVGLASRLPRGVVAAPRGFLLFDTGDGPNAVRLLAHDGSTLFQQVSFPDRAQRLGGSAVALEREFVLTAYDGERSTPEFGLLWLGQHGEVARFGMPAGSSWRDARVIPLAGDSFALAATSDIAGTSASGGWEGNLDVAVFRPGTPAFGFRLLRDCYHFLNLRGFTSDDLGNLYVSTLGGSRAEPRSMVCRFPMVGDASCYESEPELVLRAIVATADRVLFAATDREILRLELAE